MAEYLEVWRSAAGQEFHFMCVTLSSLELPSGAGAVSSVSLYTFHCATLEVSFLTYKLLCCLKRC